MEYCFENLRHEHSQYSYGIERTLRRCACILWYYIYDFYFSFSFYFRFIVSRLWAHLRSCEIRHCTFCVVSPRRQFPLIRVLFNTTVLHTPLRQISICHLLLRRKLVFSFMFIFSTFYIFLDRPSWNMHSLAASVNTLMHRQTFIM